MPSRPLSKPMLKRMYLKTLAEFFKPKGRYRGHSQTVGYTIDLIAENFVIPKLTDAEMIAAHRGAFELERDGFIQRDPKKPDDYRIFTELGQKYVDEQLEDVDLGRIDIDQVLVSDELKRRVRDDYIEGDFESCVSKSFKLLEEMIRKKSNQPASAVGVKLVAAAFGSNGVLKHPDAQTTDESEGIHALMRGAIGWLRNPVNHRTVGHSDGQRTAQILAFADYLLSLVNQCK